MAEKFDIEASGLLDGLEGKARAERAELIPWLLERGITVEQIRGSFAPALLPARKILGDDGTYVSARETSEKTGIDLDVLQRIQRAMGLPRVDDPDAAVYWLMRMIEAGEDPLFVARRMVIFAAEDVGNAEPQALQVAVAVKDAVHFVGLPEGRIPLAQAATFLATCPKSNASYAAMNAAAEDARSRGPLPVPLHLRNAPTPLMKGLGYGRGYDYPHDHPDALVEQQYLPDALVGRRYYEPSDRGAEQDIGERLRVARARTSKPRR